MPATTIAPVSAGAPASSVKVTVTAATALTEQVSFLASAMSLFFLLLYLNRCFDSMAVFISIHWKKKQICQTIIMKLS